MMSIDQRLIERRREVAEDRARRNVSRLVRLLVVLGAMAAGAWLLLSPFLSVKEVITSGIAASSAHATLVDKGVVAGTPLILIRADQVAADLELDPWVRQAEVEMDWPDRVIVTVEERVPVAWVETADGWDRRAVDGVALPTDVERDASMPWALFPDAVAADVSESGQVLGALLFAAALDQELRPGAVIRAEGNGELWAEVGGYQVRLGRPVEMEEKARSLAALLEKRPREGSTLTLIAPTHPAVTPGETEDEQP
jgi:cell division protein FtsQ